MAEARPSQPTDNIKPSDQKYGPQDGYKFIWQLHDSVVEAAKSFSAHGWKLWQGKRRLPNGETYYLDLDSRNGDEPLATDEIDTTKTFQTGRYGDKVYLVGYVTDHRQSKKNQATFGIDNVNELYGPDFQAGYQFLEAADTSREGPVEDWASVHRHTFQDSMQNGGFSENRFIASEELAQFALEIMPKMEPIEDPRLQTSP